MRKASSSSAAAAAASSSSSSSSSSWPFVPDGLLAVHALERSDVSVGLTDDGLPVGLQIVGNYGHDRTTIAFAQHLAAAGVEAPACPYAGKQAD